MTNKELIQQIDSFGGIWLEHYQEKSHISSYSELRNYIQQEYNYWKRIDAEKRLDNGYSVTYRKILDNMKVVISPDNETKLTTASQYYQELHQVFDGIPRVNYRSNYGGNVLYLQMCSSKDSVEFKLKMIYVEQVKQDSLDTLEYIIGLYKGTQPMQGCLNSPRGSSKNNAAIIYLSNEIKGIKKNDAVESLNDKCDQVNARIESLITKEDEFIEDLRVFSDEFKGNTENWLSEKKEESKVITDSFTAQIQELEDAYDKKLKLSAPVKFWEDEAKKKKKQYGLYAFVSVGITVCILILGSYLINSTYQYALSNTVLSRIIPYSFVIIGIITLLIYLLKTSIRIMLSSKHLETEYSQKALFTYFFLTMLKKENNTSIPITDAEQSMIYQTLFSSPDSGLLKTGDGADINTLLTTLISKISKG